MGREDLYPVVRDDLFLFLAFLLVCGVAILIYTAVQQEVGYAGRPSSAAPGPSTGAAASGAGHSPSGTGYSPPRAGHGPTPGNARALTSPRTGLVWADYLEPRLSAELSRAAAADQDIALARIRIDEPFADAKLPLVHESIAAILKESFPMKDLIFETGSDSYSLLLPDSDVDAAVRNLEAFRKIVAGAAIQGRLRSVSVGVSSRGGRLLEERTLLEEADVSLAKASREGGNQVIGFRADPSRFRDTLTGRHT
jgi:GGDEF domain-containing protein